MSTPLPIRTGRLGWAFYFWRISMAKIPYKKLPLSYQDQLSQLEKRGMQIPNKAKALHLLEMVSYYRLSGYWYPMLDGAKTAHIFKPTANFDDAFRLYCFDRELRKLIAGEIEKIEIAFRAKMTYVLAHDHGPFWYQDSRLFKNYNSWDTLRQHIYTEKDRSEEEFIRAFSNKYSDPLPPSWILLEILSLGTLSKLYKNLDKNVPAKRKVANYFGLHEKVLESWVHCLTYVRNLCAHHSRLWNKDLRVTPVFPKSPRKQFLPPASSVHFSGPKVKVYSVLAIIVYFLNCINPNHSFKAKLSQLFIEFPTVDIRAMDFPNGWETDPFWIK